jgi:hypothetical protein
VGCARDSGTELTRSVRIHLRSAGYITPHQ